MNNLAICREKVIVDDFRPMTGQSRDFGQGFEEVTKLPFEVAAVWVKRKFPREKLNTVSDWGSKRWYVVEESYDKTCIVIKDDDEIKLYVKKFW